MSASTEDVNYQTVKNGMMAIQDALCSFLVQNCSQNYLEDLWTYEKGTGGGRTRVWEEDEDKAESLEKGGVNFSAISGDQLPPAALSQMPTKISNAQFRTTGVSVVIHPHNPMVPTIHMNVRYFEAGDLEKDDVQVWWFGGGIDLTPTYPQFAQIIQFHKGMQEVCLKHNQDYDKFKKTCDEYFYLPHRKECRGVGGIFFDHLNGMPKNKLWDFVYDVGMKFISLYAPFLNNQTLPYTPEQRKFQLWRRSRYVEFNLLWDRGTKFGIQSNGRTESILMTMPKTACWKYSHTPSPGTPEFNLVKLYLTPRDWVNLKEEDEQRLLKEILQ